MGMALTACTTPGLGRAELRPAATTRWRSASASTASRAATARSSRPAAQVVERMATVIVEDLPYESGDRVLAFVNGMGGTPLIELYIVYRDLHRFLEGRGIAIGRNLDRQLHHLAGDGRLLDHAAPPRRRAHRAVGRAREHAGPAMGGMSAAGATLGHAAVTDWLRRFAAAVAEHKAELVRLDTAIGDGDHGTNMDRGMRKVVEKLDGMEGPDIGATLKAVGMTLVSSVGGAAGPLYGTLFLQMGTAVRGPRGARPRGLDGGARLGRPGRQDARQGGAGRQDHARRAAAGARGAARRRPRRARRCRTRSTARRTPRARGWRRRSRSRRARAAPATSARGASATRTPGRRRRTCCCAPPRRPPRAGPRPRLTRRRRPPSPACAARPCATCGSRGRAGRDPCPAATRPPCASASAACPMSGQKPTASPAA